MGGAGGSRAVVRVAVWLVIALVAALPLPAVVAAPVPPSSPPAPFDGDPSTTERLFARHPRMAALAVSRARFTSPLTRPVLRVVLAREDDFADALTGSALTTNAPLLLTPRDELPRSVAAEIERVLPPAGTVVLLGGRAAIGEAVEAALRRQQYRVQRLAGPTRVETALAVADAVRAERGRGRVLLARAYGTADNPTAAWADAVGGGGYAAAAGLPVLLTPRERLHPAVAAWLAADRPAATVLLGGLAALSAAIETAVPAPRRVGGAERQATAAAIATQLWGVRAEGTRRFLVTNGYRADGWGFGLAAAGLSADARAPVLLAGERLVRAARPLLATCGDEQVDLLVVGDASVVSPGLREELDALDGDACAGDASVQRAAALAPFGGCEPAADALRAAAVERVGPYGLTEGFAPGVPMPLPVTEAPPGDSGAAPAPGSSQTNVQEAGVDEPDLVKTDGEVALVVARGRLQVVDVREVSPRLHDSLPLPPGYQHEVLLHAARALVLTSSFDEQGPRTIVTKVDLADPAAPRVDAILEMDGGYRGARMVDGVARVVVGHAPQALPFTAPRDWTPEAEHDAAERNRDVVRSSALDDWLPAYRVRDADGERSGWLVDCAAVHQTPWFSGLVTTTVVAVPVDGPLEPGGSATVAGGAEVVYGSTSGVYVTTSRWGDTGGFVPDGVTTEVHAFEVDGGDTVRYAGSGQVPGTVLNQFALSEHEGNVRIATTVGFGDAAESGVTVLAPRDGSLQAVGSVAGMGRGERITAVRFLGDLGVVVTFRQIDPLYLLDLSDPTAPQVTGELKIPGFSSYLHRVGQDRLLGVGQDADQDGRPLGTQVSLFDIADRAAPRRVAQVQFAPGFSEVADDHRSFLFWQPTGLAVLPLVEYATRTAGEFVGAVGVRVDADRLVETGRTEHPRDRGSWAPVHRALVAGGTLYTVSDAGIQAADLDTLAERAFLAFEAG